MTNPNPSPELRDAEDKIAGMIAFGASEAAPYLYPEVDQQPVRAAYCDGAAQGARALLRWQEERALSQTLPQFCSETTSREQPALAVSARGDCVADRGRAEQAAPGEVERLREALAKAKQAARYIAVGDGYYDPYANHIEAVDAVVDAALSSSVSPEKPLATVAAANDEAIRQAAREAVGNNTSLYPWHVIDETIAAMRALATSRSQHEGASS